MRTKKIVLAALIFAISICALSAQEVLPLDTNNWRVKARAHVFEKHLNQDAIYLQGLIVLKGVKFLNGTIEYDIHLKEEQSFPGVNFRIVGNNWEQFFLRPHLSGKADANQAAPATNGITPWQLYFGPRYSFPYEYNYQGWTHVKLVVNGKRAQVYLDYSDKPNLSWELYHEPREGAISFRAGGGLGAQHLANIRIEHTTHEIVDFEPIERTPIEGLVPEWQVSSMFEEKLLDDPDNIDSITESINWEGSIQVEEGIAANISRKINLFDGSPGNTVFAKIDITSKTDQLKLFHFGYSDRVVAILNGEAIYRGNNEWRSRDYRYLGTVGLFDAIYLNLKKGKNTLLMAVSEDFGGWLITGKFEDEDGVEVK